MIRKLCVSARNTCYRVDANPYEAWTSLRLDEDIAFSRGFLLSSKFLFLVSPSMVKLFLNTMRFGGEGSWRVEKEKWFNKMQISFY